MRGGGIVPGMPDDAVLCFGLLFLLSFFAAGERVRKSGGKMRG